MKLRICNRSKKIKEDSKPFQISDFQIPDILHLMEIYLAEWQHRDQLLWRQIFTYFYVTVFVLFLPNIAAAIKINLPNFNTTLFPVLSLLLSLVFGYISWGYTKRLEAVGKTYQRIMAYLPPELQRIRLDSSEIKHGRPVNYRMSTIICTVMFLILFILSVVMIIYNIML